MRYRGQLTALGVVLAAANPAVAAVMPLEEAARLFGARQGTAAADLSPLGDKVVYLSGEGGARTVVKVFDLAANKESRIIASDGDPETLQWCEFATESWLVCRYGGNALVNNYVVGFGRLVAINLDKNQVKPLGVRSDFDLDDGIHQEDGRILDWLTDGQEGAVLMARDYVPQRGETGSNIRTGSAGGLGVDRIDLASMHVTRVEPPKVNTSMFMTDGRGKVRLFGVEEVARDGVQLSGKTKFRYRLAADKEWRDLGVYDARDDSGPYPLAIDQASDSLYYLQKQAGRDALFRMKLDGTKAAALVAKNDAVDISGVVRVSRGQPVIGYRYTDEKPRIEYFDTAYKNLATALGRALPASPIIDFAGASRDASKLLVHASADTSAGTYYILDRSTHKMESILLDRPDLDGKVLAPVRSVSFRAADGTAIPAYLTMPAGAGKNLPTVVLPHGGPSARDEWGFDWVAQFLAARGYAVIQPNYRGSAGFGDKFLGENAFRDWKTAMSDIRDSANYLVTEGIADPNRMAILGWSYGGYAALQSAVTDPTRYKAVIAIAPVTDLSALRGDAEGFNNADLVKDFVGKDDNLRSGSPLHHAAAIKAPVLLVHGDLDGNVRVAHSLRMESALRKAGTPVELLRYKKLEHQLDDSSARTEMLTHIGALLDRTIGH